jgi:valyl-tRNA synthetase
MVSSFPSIHELGLWKDESAERDMKVALDLIQASRALRQSHQVPMSKELPFTIWTSDPSLLVSGGALQQSREYLSHFTRAQGEIAFIDGSSAGEDQQGVSAASIVHVVSPQVKLFTSQSAVQKAIASAGSKASDATAPSSSSSSSQSGVTDRAKQQQQELQRLDRKLGAVRADLEKLDARVAQPQYLERVPDHVRAIDAKRRHDLLAQEEHLMTTIHTLRGAVALE